MKKRNSYLCIFLILIANFSAFAEELVWNTNSTYVSGDSGYLPRPVEIKKGAEPVFTRFNLLGDGEIPATYDLRNLGLVSSVKNQSPTSTCWTFAGMSVLESALLKNNLGKPYDYSEANLNYALTKSTSTGDNNLEGFDRPLNSGGFFEMIMSYLSRGSGPILESNDPFTVGANPAPRLLSITNSKPKEKYVTKMYQLPNLSFEYQSGTKILATYTDIERQAQITRAKQWVMNYGVLFCSYYSGNYYNAANTAYYYPQTQNSLSNLEYPNHAVSIVGWDDNYSATNFKPGIQPPANGAFLIKNSWGSSWGQQGYFWLSYYDKFVANDIACIAEIKNVKYYDNIYYYDPLGVTATFGYSGTVIVGANKFTASQTGEILKAVGFNSIEENLNYEIYVNKNGKALNSTTLTKVAQGTLQNAGYYTINIPEQIINGSDFAVAVKFIKSTNTAMYFPLENPSENTYSTKATSNSGEGYVCYQIPTQAYESRWLDMNDYNASVCIKALTDKPTSSVSFYNGNDEVITSTTENDTVVSNIKVQNATANTRAVLATYQGNKLYNIEYKTGLTNNDINVFNSTLPSGTGYTFKTILLDENTLNPLINNGYSIVK